MWKDKNHLKKKKKSLDFSEMFSSLTTSCWPHLFNYLGGKKTYVRQDLYNNIPYILLNCAFKHQQKLPKSVNMLVCLNGFK